jgi:hypothetical protein
MRSITEGLDINRKSVSFSQHSNETVGEVHGTAEGLNIDRKPKVLIKSQLLGFSASKTRVDVRSTDVGLNIDRKPKVLIAKP